MAEFQQQEVLNSSGEQGLLIWLLKRIRIRTFDANKLYSTEILSILLQNNTGNQQLLGAKNGIDCLLEAVSLYKRREPVTGDEIEMVENLFDCLCMSLTHAPNRVKFLEGEGLQLMILLLKDRYVVLLNILYLYVILVQSKPVFLANYFFLVCKKIPLYINFLLTCCKGMVRINWLQLYLNTVEFDS